MFRLNRRRGIIFQYLSLKLINQPASPVENWIICLEIRTRLITEGAAPLVCNLQASFVKASAQCWAGLGWASSEIQNFLCPEKILPFESQTNKGVIRQNNFKISQRMKESFQIFQYQRLRKWSLSLSVSPLDIKFIWKQSLSSSEFSNRTKSNWY